MKAIFDPADYEAWYQSPRGRWIADREYSLMCPQLYVGADASLLDVGCGTGHFSRRFARAGFSMTGLDPDTAALQFARSQGESVHYVQGSALSLPFAENAFDSAIAVTSLCFIDDVILALQEMWRVSRYSLVLGLLNRHSLLHRRKQGQGSYQGARWDTASDVLRQWVPALTPVPGEIKFRYAVFHPGGSGLAQWSETWLPGTLPWGGFMAVGLSK